MVKSFPASLDKLYEMLQFVRDQAIACGFKHSPIFKIELAIEEALVNIISYGYIDRLGTIEIDIDSSLPKGLGMKIIIRDGGIPYNPLTNAKLIDLTSPLEKRVIGGYGIFFMLKVMDEVDYKRENNYNILTLVKYVT